MGTFVSMSDRINVGDRVAWTSSGGKSIGRVKKRLTEPIEIKGHHVAASTDHPEFLVESDTGGRAAHKPASLKKAGSAASASEKTAKKKTTKKKKAAPKNDTAVETNAKA